jgi:predicted transcriptional regulator
MTITLKPETEARLRERAAREGVDVSAIADEIVLAGLEWGEREHAEAVDGLRHSLAESDSGRVRRFSEVAAEWRVKYNLPAHLSDDEILAGESGAAG